MDYYNKLFDGIYKDKTVLVTGHTGFKGSWLSLWLELMGANVIGYALEPPTEPSHFKLLNLNMTSIIGDIRDTGKLSEVMNKFKPEIVFHLAAQPIVIESYRNPIETFDVNVLGSLKVYQACRNTDSVKAIVSITTDKVYKNREWEWGYRENDSFGGFDPYSASKACVEIATDSFRSSFFNPDMYNIEHNKLICTTRAGNVIGGGDWAADRLIPDIMKATSKNEKVVIRNPGSTRPWQHVLEPLAGYLMLGEKLLKGEKQFAEGWNFGPVDDDVLTVGDILVLIRKYWDIINYEIMINPNALHEAGMLKLDISKANYLLDWKPVWNMNKAIERITNWYKNYYQNNVVNSVKDLELYISDARSKNAPWTN
jgi:CDP-glucose 4,6-dehydratase